MEIVHEDADLLVVSKPAGIATTAPEDGDCLTRRARALRPGTEVFHPTSRLDTPVSGMVTFAKTRRAIEALDQARKQDAYARLYLALTDRVPVPEVGEWSWPIAIDPRDARHRTVEKGARQQAALTHYRVRSMATRVALLELRPHTGRTHQLRVHAEAAGSPLLGDRAYGGATRMTLDNGRVVSARRVMLHCAALRYPSLDGGVLCLELAPPRDFERCFTAVGGTPDALIPGRA